MNAIPLLVGDKLNIVSEFVAQGKPYKVSVRMSHRSIDCYLIGLSSDHMFRIVTRVSRKKYESTTELAARAQQVAEDLTGEIREKFEDHPPSDA